MLDDLMSSIRTLLGIGAADLNFWQILLRALLLYLVALALVRMGESRILGKNTAFDFIMGIILGSVISRAINGTAPFFETIGAGVALIALHWLVAVLTFHSTTLSRIFKGRAELVVSEGRPLQNRLREHHLGQHDLEEALRKNGHITDVGMVREAYFERDGSISVIPQRPGPRVVEVRVEQGVQTVRIELD